MVWLNINKTSLIKLAGYVIIDISIEKEMIVCFTVINAVHVV